MVPDLVGELLKALTHQFQYDAHDLLTFQDNEIYPKTHQEYLAFAKHWDPGPHYLHFWHFQLFE